METTTYEIVVPIAEFVETQITGREECVSFLAANPGIRLDSSSVVELSRTETDITFEVTIEYEPAA